MLKIERRFARLADLQDIEEAIFGYIEDWRIPYMPKTAVALSWTTS